MFSFLKIPTVMYERLNFGYQYLLEIMDIFPNNRFQETNINPMLSDVGEGHCDL